MKYSWLISAVIVSSILGSMTFAFASDEIINIFKHTSEHGLLIDKRYVGINDQTKGSQLEIHCIYDKPSNCNLFMNRENARSNLILFGEEGEFQASIVERKGEVIVYTDYPNGAKKQLVIKQDGVYLPDTLTERVTDLCKITINEDRSLTCER